MLKTSEIRRDEKKVSRNYRLPLSTVAALEAAAKRLKVKKSDIVRTAIEQALGM